MKKRIAKLIPLLGIFSVIFYFLHVILGGMFYEGYNPLAQAISDLTASNSPSKNIARLFSLLYGICAVSFSIGFFVYFRNKINKVVTAASFIFCIMNIISFLGYTFFPLSESGYAATFQDKMHMVVTVFVVLLTIVSLVLYFTGFFRTREHKWLGVVSISTLLILMAGALLINIMPKEYFGVAERINVYSIIIYTGILSLWMKRYIGKEIT
jgi:surface polysaccharide O-acyltransferase-like enzyme